MFKTLIENWHWTPALVGLVAGMAGTILVLIMIDGKKLINDTLKNPANGQWSRKNITGFFCMGFAMSYCWIGMIRERPIQEFVVAIFVGAGLTCLGISSWEKANVKPKPPKEE